MQCYKWTPICISRLRLKRDDTRAETRFCLSAKRTSPFKSAGVSVKSTAGSRGVSVSGSNAGYTMFRGSVKSSVFPSFPLPFITVCHQFSKAFLLNVYWFHAVSLLLPPHVTVQERPTKPHCQLANLTCTLIITGFNRRTAS